MQTLRRRRGSLAAAAATMLLVVVLAASCASLVKNSAATLSASADLYNIAMTVVRELQDEGIISDEQRLEINKVANIYFDAHNVALDALIAYNAAKNAEKKDALKAAMDKVNESWDDVQSLINSIRPNSVPASLGGG